ncbi:MAG: 3-hydroxyacyl-CoA dehydrogenase family protein [Ruminococcaceae bacterium]|nr:3-hydroxyacyl-CoA dehydrogenase family protein [Oscillospiraceae bacterium]
MKIKKVCVIGGGLMGRQIALNTAIYSYEVTLTDSNPDVLDAVAKWEEEYLAGRIAKGRMTEEQVAGIKSRFHIVSTLEEAAKDADLVIEAIVEVEDIKRELFRKLSALTREDTIIATNSSRMCASLFKDEVKNPARFANLHYFNPALVMKLTEVVQGEHCSSETAETLMEFSRSTGKTPVLLKREIEGFIANRLLNALKNEARYLVENGYCTIEDVDTASENGLGHPMGPFRLEDLTGIDLTYNIMMRTYEKTGEKPIGFELVKSYYDKGFYGKKNGRGYYDYSQKK